MWMSIVSHISHTIFNKLQTKNNPSIIAETKINIWVHLLTLWGIAKTVFLILWDLYTFDWDNFFSFKYFSWIKFWHSNSISLIILKCNNNHNMIFTDHHPSIFSAQKLYYYFFPLSSSTVNMILEYFSHFRLNSYRL